MSFTSNWSFKSLGRGRSTSLSGASYFSRENYTVIRERYSDDTFSSESGTTALSLSGYNGGVLETITAPQVYGNRFATSTNWVLNTSVWIESGIQYSGRPVYIQVKGTDNLPDSAKVNAVYFTDTGVYDYNKANLQLRRAVSWNCGEFSGDAILSGDFSKTPTNRASGPSSAVIWKTFETPPAPGTFDISPFGSYSGTGTFSGASVFSQAYTGNGAFFCIDDVQTYEQNGIPWYKQTQTWVFRGSYSS